METPGSLSQTEAGETEAADRGRGEGDQATEAHTQAAEDSHLVQGRGGDHCQLQQEADKRGQVGQVPEHQIYNTDNITHGVHYYLGRADDRDLQ